jgi:uncharacterized protein
MDLKGAKAYALQQLHDGLSPTLTYHGRHHTMDVYKTAVEYARLEGITGDDLTLLRTAALFHDIGFIDTYRGHEARGCEVVREVLPRFHYSPEQIERVCGMIMATQLPQTPHNQLEKIICDCDLDYLGRTDFYHIGFTLFEEFKAYGILATEEDWNRLQVNFLTQHSYFTQTANRLRQPMKEQHLAEIKRVVAAYA